MSVHYNDVKRSNRLKAIKSTKHKSTNVKSIRLLTSKLLTGDLSKSLCLNLQLLSSLKNIFILYTHSLYKKQCTYNIKIYLLDRVLKLS